MEVSVVSSVYEDDKDLLFKIYLAYRQCYHSTPITDIDVNELDTHECKAFIQKMIVKGHLSPLEHESLTFFVSGVSRITTHQLVRHRIASYTQQSQRYCPILPDNLIFPPSTVKYFEEDPKRQEKLQAVFDMYKEMIQDYDIPKEDARYFIPHGMGSCIFITMNLRSLMHFFNERLCGSAQWEIRHMAKLMAKETLKIFPWLNGYIGPKCVLENDCMNGRAEMCEEGIEWQS